jgi:galactokinase
LDTSTRRGLVDSQYNQRREQCAAAARALGAAALRDVTMEQLNRAAAELPPLVLSRARHVVGENERTRRAAEAMRRGDAAELGRLMRESHRSLRDDYEVSSAALDTMVLCAEDHPACLGARMTGAGFGGCAVALVRADAAADFCRAVGEAYLRRAGLTPAVHLCHAAAGVEAFHEQH